MFKILPSGAAVKPERITGLDIVDCTNECRVFIITEERSYYAETFTDKDSACQYIIDTVKELEGGVTVKVKEYDDGIITTSENFDLLCVDEEGFQPITVGGIAMMLYFKNGNVYAIYNGKSILVRKFGNGIRAYDFVCEFVVDYGDWINWKNCYFNVDKLIEVEVNRATYNDKKCYELYAVFDGGDKFKFYDCDNADFAFDVRDYIRHKLESKR